jgi:hypothetical protein
MNLNPLRVFTGPFGWIKRKARSAAFKIIVAELKEWARRVLHRWMCK